MSDSNSSTLPVYTIEIGTPGTFTNDATFDISSEVNTALEAAPAGYQINLIINPGTYDVANSILLPSNTSVTGDDATLLGTTSGCHILANADSSYLWSPVSTLGSYGPNTIIDANISIAGLTFIEGDEASFGIFFTNAENIDIQNNVFIGGTDAEALVNVVNANVTNNVAAGMRNAAYDSWNGPSNVTVDDNIAYVYGSGASEWSPGSSWAVLLNSSPSGDPSNPGNAVNDGIVDNILSSSWANSGSVYAGALLSYGYTYQTLITQQGNITFGLSVPNSGSASLYSPVSSSTIQDDSFVGLVSSPGNNWADVLLAANGSTAGPNGDAKILGNLILGLYSANTDSAITNGSPDPSTVNNAVLNQNTLASQSIATAAVDPSSAGNITGSGNDVNGSGVIPALDIAAPPTLFAEPSTAVGVSGVSLEDSTTGTIEVTITTQFGTLSFGSEVYGLQYGTICGEPGVILTGSLDQINADLSEITFTSNGAGWDDNIEIRALDSEGNLATRYIPVIVSGSETSLSDVMTITPGEIPISQDSSVPESYSGLGLPVAPNLGLDTVIGASGDNVINMGSSTSIVFLEAGNNTIFGGQVPAYIVTGSGNSVIDLLSGGDVSIAGGSGPMTVNAATGNDVIDSGASNALVQGGSGSSTVVGGLGALTVNGGTGSLYIATLPQDGGNLTATLGSGNSTVFALSGNDYIATSVSTANFIDLGIGNDCVSSAGADVILAGAGNDTIDASSGGSDTIFGGAGSLDFIAGSENSVVQVGSGVNTIEGGLGNLTVNGGSGKTYIATLPQNGGNLTANLTWGDSTVFALSGNDYIKTNFYTDNFIDLGTGNDCVVAVGAGSDTILTGVGSDTIDASSGGSESVVGGSGSLYFFGGTGNSFVDPASQTTILAGGGNLTIGGSGNVSLLQISDILATSRVITVDYSSADISLIEYGVDPIISQNLSDNFLDVTLSDGTLLKLYDPQSMVAVVSSGTLSLTPWSNVQNPDVVNIDNLLANTVAPDVLDTSALETVVSEIPYGHTAVLYADLPSNAAVINDGTVILDPTYLTLENPLTGNGVIEIDTGSGLAVEGSVASTQTISFSGIAGSLIIGDVSQFNGTITGFMGDNSIDLSTVPFSNSGIATLTSGNVLDVIENGQTAAIQLDRNQSYAGNVFDISNDGLGGTNVIDATNFTVPDGETNLFVDAPATEKIVGNGSDNFSATFGSASSVSFNSEGGSGTVVAGGIADFVNVTGTTWSIVGNAGGSSTVDSSATAGTEVQVYGQGDATNNALGADTTPSNVVGLAGNASVSSYGTNDLIETFSGNDIITVYDSANVLVNGGADTVYAAAGSTAVRAFFNLEGGRLNFINNSTSSSTVSGDVPGASGGNVTAFGGAGGGVFIGGSAGNNSLVGGAGDVTLVGAGANNYLEAKGYASASAGENILSAGAGGAYMLATSTTGYNEFHGGTGTDTMVSYGSGAQVFYVGSSGAEQITGATTSGAINEYVFDQAPSQGGADIITNFRLGTDHIDINFDTSVNGVVTIQSYQSLGGAHSGSIIYLSDNTTIQLYGVSAASLNASIVGGTHI